jgi:hypothetical protein
MGTRRMNITLNGLDMKSNEYEMKWHGREIDVTLKTLKYVREKS